MHASEKPITRRDFLRGAAYVGLAGAMGLPMSVEQEGKPKKKVRVVLVRDAKALNDGSRPNADVIQRMLDDAVTTLLDEKDPVKAWKLLIKPTDIVGIKSNAWHYMPTPKELERAIQRRVMDAGVPEENIAIDDRGVLSNPIFIQSTALINTRPVRTHFWAGIGGCIKNYIMFAPEPSDYHPDSCADLAMVWYLPIVKGKTRLNVMSLLRPLFHGRGAHHYDPKYVWDYKGLLVGTDPVALDATALRIIQAKRLQYFGEDRRLETLPTHIAVADTKHKLGTSDPKSIELVKLGWTEGILI
jgi:hypothetical protein